MMRICLFEDRQVLNLEPLIYTRPAYELLCGQSSLGDKQWRHFGPAERGALIRPQLAELQRTARPGAMINDSPWLTHDRTILVNSRWLPPTTSTVDINSPHVATIDGEVAYAVLDPDHVRDCTPDTIDECLTVWKGDLPTRETDGQMIHYLWDLVDLNEQQLLADFTQSSADGARAWRPGVATVGPADRLRIDPSAQIDPMVVADTTNGPVVIGPRAVVTAFSRLEGPCYIGAKTQIMGAKIRAGTTIGPECRIGGEVEASIIQGYSNKYHEGFLGHSYVGEWVNLGAGTHNSDLRNDYGEVAVTVNGHRIGSGRRKIGCYIGDHTKSGLGCLLNTGTNAGVFCNLLPTAGLLSKYVPSFSTVWNGQLQANDDTGALFTTAERVMSRRDVELTEAHLHLYSELADELQNERQRAIRDAEQRRLRRSA